MTVIWMPRAVANLQSFIKHIAETDPEKAHNFIDDLALRTAEVLSAHPQTGRLGRVQGTYEWVAHKNYVVAYRITQTSEVHILDVVHAARLWPGSF